MKQIVTFTLTLLTISAFGQDKYNYTHVNKLIEIEGTDYVIATVENRGKTSGLNNRYLLFIDTKNGQTNQVNFPNDGYFDKIEQIKIDDLGINKVIVSAQTVDLDGKKGIDWNDPKQILILSTDGKEKTQLTDNRLFVKTWVVNKKSGCIVVTGQFDSNGNGRYDNTDKNEISIYDLKTLQLINKF